MLKNEFLSKITELTENMKEEAEKFPAEVPKGLMYDSMEFFFIKARNKMLIEDFLYERER